MKVFKRFSPIQIARYVKSFHKGAFAVESVGEFEFEAGMIRVDRLAQHKKRALAGKVNTLLRSLRPELPSYC